MPPDDRKLRRWATYKAHYPERVAVIEEVQSNLRAGVMAAEVCPDHGSMSPRYQWPDGGHVGWICYPCQPGRNHAE